jgi:hypothetical protein
MEFGKEEILQRPDTVLSLSEPTHDRILGVVEQVRE